MSKKRSIPKPDAAGTAKGPSVADVVQDDEFQVNGVGALSILSNAIAGELAAAAMQMYLEAKGITGNFRVVVTAAKLVRIQPPPAPADAVGADGQERSVPPQTGELLSMVPGAGGRAAKQRLQGNGSAPSSR